MLVVLSAHLGGDLLPGRFPGDHAGLVHGVRQRFLAVDVQAPLQGANRRRGVVVVGSRHDDRIEVLAFEQPAIVGIGLGPRVLPGRCTQPLRVDVAQRHHVFTRHRRQVAAAPTGHADDADVQPFIGSECCRRQQQPAGEQCRVLQEIATVRWHGRPPLVT